MQTCKELAIALSYATFLACIVFILAILYLTVDIGSFHDANGNIVRLLP